MAPKVLKRIHQSLWKICCITFDDNDDVSETPYGENPTLDSEEEYLKRMVHEKVVMKNVLDWITRCEFDRYDSYDESCGESTCYPSVTTCTDMSEAMANDFEARKMCQQMEDINIDLRLLSKKLDEIVSLQKLL